MRMREAAEQLRYAEEYAARASGFSLEGFVRGWRNPNSGNDRAVLAFAARALELAKALHQLRIEGERLVQR